MIKINIQLFGGRGASSGMSYDKYGKPKHKYGTEYSTLYQSGNIKFVKYNMSGATKAPLETMTSGRVYATVNEKNEIKAISYYDKNNKRSKQIDVSGQPHVIDGKYDLPHTHKGYFHSEKGTYTLSKSEQKMVDRVLKTWYYVTHK